MESCSIADVVSLSTGQNMPFIIRLHFSMEMFHFQTLKMVLEGHILELYCSTLT